MRLNGIADPFYYLDNFRLMIETLMRRDGDLLAADELTFIGDYAQLATGARALLVRMVMRQGPLFRASRLVYHEIPDLEAAVLPLIELGWVDGRPQLNVRDLVRLFSKAELVSMFTLPIQCLREPKTALLDRLWDSPCSVPYGVPDAVYRLGIAELCDRLCRMFFGNFRQTLTEFVLADLGVLRFENANPPAQSRPFRTRRQVDDFHRLYLCREMLAAGDLAGVEELLPLRIDDCDWLEDRRQKLRFRLARIYERAGQIDRALGIYESCAYPEAALRACRLIDVANGVRRRRCGDTRAVPAFELALEGPNDSISVECRVRDHLRAATEDDTVVLYVENALVNSLFGLLCWPAIFAPVPGAFFHAFHRGPADLLRPGFVERRHREFAQCLAELDSGNYRATILGRFAEKRGICSPFVTWGLLDEALLHTALECIPPHHLNHWFAWMMRDLKTNRAGFPDLVQFWPADRRYRLIEVKAPGDRLQANQRACMQHMLLLQIPVSVCHVRWQADGVDRQGGVGRPAGSGMYSDSPGTAGKR